MLSGFRSSLGWALLAISMFMGCAAPTGDGSDVGASEAALGGGDFCDTIRQREHYVDVGGGVTLHVVEAFSFDSAARRHPRALLMLPATLVTSDQWNPSVPSADGDSYNALIQAARRGFFAYSVTYEGYGLSSQPADGRVVTAERLLAETGEVVEWIRERTGARRVDLMGSSLGSSLAIALGGEHSPIDPHHIGRVVVTSHVYREVTPLFASVFFNPGVRAMLEGAPGGYVPTSPEVYGLILAYATPDAAAYGFSTFPGLYAVGPTLEGFDLPVFDASHGRARLLQVWGDADLITPRSDVDLFAAEYGGRYELAVIPGGGHAPNFEAGRDAFFDAVFDFLSVRPGHCARRADHHDDEHGDPRADHHADEHAGRRGEH